MARFYGVVKGRASTAATRTGHKTTGLTTVCASWEGAVESRVYYDAELGRDIVEVRLIPWRGNGQNILLYEGPIGGTFVP